MNSFADRRRTKTAEVSRVPEEELCFHFQFPTSTPGQFETSNRQVLLGEADAQVTAAYE